MVEVEAGGNSVAWRETTSVAVEVANTLPLQLQLHIEREYRGRLPLGALGAGAELVPRV